MQPLSVTSFSKTFKIIKSFKITFVLIRSIQTQILNQSSSIYFYIYFSLISGEGNGNPLQYSCLENPMDGGAWQATVHGVAKSWTRLSDFTSFLYTLHLYQESYVSRTQVITEYPTYIHLLFPTLHT